MKKQIIKIKKSLSFAIQKEHLIQVFLYKKINFEVYYKMFEENFFIIRLEKNGKETVCVKRISQWKSSRTNCLFCLYF